MRRKHHASATIACFCLTMSAGCIERPDTPAQAVASKPESTAHVAVAVEAPSEKPVAPWSCAGSRTSQDGSVALLYSDVSVSEETHDASGTEFELTRDSTLAWSGTVRIADGQLGRAEPLVSLAIDSLGGSIRLSYAQSARGPAARFDGLIVCDSLYGTWTPYPTVHDQHTWKRISRSGEVPPGQDR